MDEKTAGLARVERKVDGKNEGKNGHSQAESGAGAGGGDVARLGRDIDAIRDNLDTLVDELERRRRAAMNFKLQARLHPVKLAVTATIVVGLMAGAIALGVVQRRRHARIAYRARRFGHGFARLLRSIERQHAAVEERRATGLGGKLLAAAAKLTIAIAARRLGRRRRTER